MDTSGAASDHSPPTMSPVASLSPRNHAESVATESVATGPSAIHSSFPPVSEKPNSNKKVPPTSTSQFPSQFRNGPSQEPLPHETPAVPPFTAPATTPDDDELSGISEAIMGDETAHLKRGFDEHATSNAKKWHFSKKDMEKLQEDNKTIEGREKTEGQDSISELEMLFVARPEVWEDHEAALDTTKVISAFGQDEDDYSTDYEL